MVKNCQHPEGSNISPKQSRVNNSMKKNEIALEIRDDSEVLKRSSNIILVTIGIISISNMHCILLYLVCRSRSRHTKKESKRVSSLEHIIKQT